MAKGDMVRITYVELWNFKNVRHGSINLLLQPEGFKSSVPGIVHAFVCPTQSSSTRKRSIRFITDKITSICQKPARKPCAPFTA